MKVETSTVELECENIENPFENFSFLKYLYNETVTPEIERESSIYKNRKKRIHTFLSIPMNLESFLIYALIICVDHFLWLYTFLPIKCILLPLKIFKRLLSRTKKSLLLNEEIEDFVKFSFVIIATLIVSLGDISVTYHRVRSQSVIKLYIIFNILEVADKLLSPLSQDVMDALSWTISKNEKRSSQIGNFICQYIFAAICFAIHVVVMLLQTTVLNVAFNSHNSALLIIMLSNNFIEIKGNVFKKAEKSNLFQMSCADSRERFHYIIMLSLIVFRNLRETGWSTDEVLSMVKLCSSILLCEVMVDWIKHAFVTKFNFITAEVYNDFSVTLAYDILLCHMGKNLCSYFELMSRRMVLTSIPLACLVNVFILGWLQSTLAQFWILLLIGCFVMKIIANLLLLKLSYSKVKAYLTTAKNTQQATTTNGQEKDSSISDIYSKQNDYEIILPRLNTILKRTASFSEGFQLPNDENSNKSRLGRSSLVLIDTQNQLESTNEDGETNSEEKYQFISKLDENDVIRSKCNSPSSDEVLKTGSEPNIIRKRCRTISSLTEDLSEGSIEPLNLQSDEATGITSDINDGSKCLLMNTNNCNISKSDDNSNKNGSREIKEE